MKSAGAERLRASCATIRGREWASGSAMEGVATAEWLEVRNRGSKSAL